MTKDFFALSVLDPLLNSDDSARMYRKLVREDRLAMSSQGGFNFLGPNWDMKGPMLYTMRVDYFNDKTADQVLAAIESVLDDVRKNGITAAELAQAKTTMRSAFLDDMEGGGMPLFGRANLLGVFALFDDDPGAHQHHPRRARQGDARRREGRGGEVVGAGEPHVDRQPAGGQVGAGRCAMIRPPSLLRSFGAQVACGCRACRLPPQTLRGQALPTRRPSVPSGRSRRRRVSSARCRTACA